MRRAIFLVLSVVFVGCAGEDAQVASGGGGMGGDAPGGASGEGGEPGQAGEGGDGGRADVPDGCPALAGEGTVHGGSVSEDETWTASDSPHFLTSDLSIYATLTLEPCAVVRVADDKGITVRADGAILAQGSADQPIRIEPDGDVNWYGITLLGGTARLSHTRIIGGGSAQNVVPDRRGALELHASVDDPIEPDPVLFVDHVSIEDSVTQGFVAQAGGGFDPDSRALTITGSRGHVATMAPNLLETLPEGNYLGNARDDILLPDDLPGQIHWDVTIHDRGIPYFSGGTNQTGMTSVGSLDGTTGTVVLTIEPGVIWRFKKDTGLLSIDPNGESTGVLIAKGTKQKPIIFSSGEEKPAAGDWLGIRMGGSDARNKLDWVTIEYAGKLVPGAGSDSCQSLTDGVETHNGAALRVYLVPPATLVSNSTFLESATNGIDRGWRDDSKPSFLSNNTFTNIALCNETFPRDSQGNCPEDPPCPTTP